MDTKSILGSKTEWIRILLIVICLVKVECFLPFSNFRMFAHPAGERIHVIRFVELNDNALSPSASIHWEDSIIAKPSGGITNLETTMPPRKAKHKRRRSASGKKEPLPNSAVALTDDEIRQHVTAQYIHGPGGTLRSVMVKRQQLNKNNQKLQQRLPVASTGDNSHLEQLRRLDQHPALVLNADYQPISYLPLSMWHWQEVVKAVFSGKVTVVEVYPDVTIRAANLEVPLPSVIALNEFVPQPNNKPAFTKRNVFLRDEYRCQYCSQRFHTRDLSLDHVLPRCLGGRLVWENAVTCCKKCNGRKGSLTLNEIKNVGMNLNRLPFIPTQYQLHKIAGQMLPKKVHPTWAPYLGLTFNTVGVDNDFHFSELVDEMFLEDIP